VALLDLLFALLELFLEVLFQVAAEALFDLALRGLGEVLVRSEFKNPLVATIGYVALGALTGGLSLIIFPHPLVHPSRLHGISLLVAPIVTGSLMALIGSVLHHQGKKTTQIESFGYGFAFAFGMALIRLIFAE
jgi:hypothetical protein